ncbi:2',3'-cyclic-nucleotide 3'-phosphodiesterase [Chionoecetes opilio]|uniref:2',3'-cyclic-nucleotide 3'-phosphodiesterase n=1 Tax=Chionoecetes opilio TaxID=41210 RepID=A0A8J5D0M3_CHIOP|nr:2',3'-cyclic-nucleotide 3'-phosphodiesterase [Chionoecetes opilio]
MGQCCERCKERQEELVIPQAGSRPSLAPLVPEEEFLEPQDEYLSALEQDVPRVSHESLPAAPTPEAYPTPAPPMGEHLYYPILQDKETMEYVQNSKVMVIMKGLPGAGKSHLSSLLNQMYQGATVCSADLYFMKDGEYKFDVEKLKFAHEFCQQSAKKAAVSGAPVIIIDNTNLQAWNYKYYLRLSKDHHYTPLIIEPQTPWAKDTEQLAGKNSHGLTKEILDQRLKKYEAPKPIYYWWFLNEEDSSQILTVAQSWLKKSLHIQEFIKDFYGFSKLSSVEDVLNYYTKNEGHGGYTVLHATACITKKGKAKNAKEYMAKEAVKNSLGKVFPLHIIGFVMTPRTFGVRLRLEEEALEVWGMDDHETEAEDTLKTTSGKESQKTEKTGQQSAGGGERVSIGDTSLRSSCHTTLRTGESQLHSARFHPTAGKGCRAHLTLGCAPQVQAKITGYLPYLSSFMIVAGKQITYFTLVGGGFAFTLQARHTVYAPSYDLNLFKKLLIFREQNSDLPAAEARCARPTRGAIPVLA